MYRLVLIALHIKFSQDAVDRLVSCLHFCVYLSLNGQRIGKGLREQEARATQSRLVRFGAYFSFLPADSPTLDGEFCLSLEGK